MTDHPESEPAPPRPEPEPELTTASLARAAPASDKPAPGDAERRSFAPAGTPGADAAPLFASDEAQGLRDRWDAIQAGFVDEPRQAVEQADSLVATAMKRLAEIFADERAGLEASGTAATTSRPRTCGWRCSVTARSSADCWRSSGD